MTGIIIRLFSATSIFTLPGVSLHKDPGMRSSSVSVSGRHKQGRFHFNLSMHVHVHGRGALIVLWNTSREFGDVFISIVT